jgi:hypothetical protein
VFLTTESIVDLHFFLFAALLTNSQSLECTRYASASK